MTQHKLIVGSRVRAKRYSASVHTASFRVEKLVALAGGQLLYRIRCESEPFDRIVDEHEIIPQTTPETIPYATGSEK
jgi:hypothetical protein